MPRKKKVRMGSHTIEIAETWARYRPDLDPSKYLLLIHLIRLGRILGRVDDKHCRSKFGISGTDMSVLYALRRVGLATPPRPVDLARALVMTISAVTKKLDRLKSKKLLRYDSGESGSEVVIRPTPKGIAMADAAIAEMVEGSPISSVELPLSTSERETARLLCEKMLLDLEKRLGEE